MFWEARLNLPGLPQCTLRADLIHNIDAQRTIHMGYQDFRYYNGPGLGLCYQADVGLDTCVNQGPKERGLPDGVPCGCGTNARRRR